MYSNALTVIFPILLNYITANEDLVQWEEIGECFRKAVKRADCESLSPDERFFLQLDFTNCYLSMLDFPIIDCTNMSRELCSEKLTLPAFRPHESVFSKFHSNLRQLCIQASNHLWRSNLKSKVTNLHSYSSRTLEGLIETLMNQKELIENQMVSLSNQGEIYKQTKQIRQSIESQRETVNSSFSALHCYISDQMASLKYTGSQLQSLVKMVQHISVFILGELSVVRIIFTTAFIAVFWACLSAPHEAKGSLKYLASVVLAHLIFGIILNLLVKFELLSAGQEALLSSVIFIVLLCFGVVIYSVKLLRSLLFSQAEDLDTQNLLAHLSVKVEDMEKSLMQCGLLQNEGGDEHSSGQVSLIGNGKEHLQSHSCKHSTFEGEEFIDWDESIRVYGGDLNVHHQSKRRLPKRPTSTSTPKVTSKYSGYEAEESFVAEIDSSVLSNLPKVKQNETNTSIESTLSRYNLRTRKSLKSVNSNPL